MIFIVTQVASLEALIARSHGEPTTRQSGSAEAYAIDPSTGMIKLLNHQSLHSPIPAHLAVDPTGHHLIITNYIGGDFVVLPIEADGRLRYRIRSKSDNVERVVTEDQLSYSQ